MVPSHNCVKNKEIAFLEYKTPQSLWDPIETEIWTKPIRLKLYVLVNNLGLVVSQN